MTPLARSRSTTLALFAAALALAVLLAAALIPGRDAGSPATAAAAAKTVSVKISDFKYSKAKLTVKVGTKVKWTNEDDMAHSVTATKIVAGAPNSKLFGKGKSYTWTATKKGTFKYYCTAHPYMKATVIVK